MNTKDDMQKVRRAYNAPEITAVKLRPEEAVLLVCKDANHSGQNAEGSCYLAEIPCSVVGS